MINALHSPYRRENRKTLPNLVECSYFECLFYKQEYFMFLYINKHIRCQKDMAFSPLCLPRVPLLNLPNYIIPFSIFNEIVSHNREVRLRQGQTILLKAKEIYIQRVSA